MRARLLDMREVGALRPVDGMTSIRRELAEPPGAGAIAEALIAALESCVDLELIPSMPAPEEMDAIYEWDERLTADPASDRPHRLIA